MQNFFIEKDGQMDWFSPKKTANESHIDSMELVEVKVESECASW